MAPHANVGYQTCAATPPCTYEPIVHRTQRMSWVRIAASTLSAAAIAAALLGCLLFVLPSVSGPGDAAELAIGSSMTGSQERIRPPGHSARALVNGCAAVLCWCLPCSLCLADISTLLQESSVIIFQQQQEPALRPRLVSLATARWGRCACRSGR